MNFLNRLFRKKSVVTLQMTLVDNGVLICLYKNGERIDITDLLCDNLAKKLPEPFVTYFSSQQYKVNIISFSTARTLLQQLHPFVSNEFKLDCKSIDDLTQVSMPPSFRIHFRLNRELQIIERIAIGADLHLGDGWFQKETTVWLIGELTSHKLLSWIYLPQISGQDLYYFVSTVIPEAQILGLPVTCELSIENNFRLNLQIQNMSRRSLSVAVVSNHPNIQKDLSYIANENLHMMSGVVILPNLRQIVTPQILEIARSPIGKRIDGLDIPRFIQDDLRPNAKSLKVEMQAIDEAYRIADGEQLQKQWQLTQEHVKGIGRYIAIPSLMWQENSISEQTFLKLLHTDQRFIQIEGGWIEFRPQTKERLRVESEQYFHRFELNVRELLGIDTDRLKPIKLELPLISVPYNPDDQDAAVEYFNTMRDHGLPAAITGLQEEIPIVFMRVCNSLLLAYPQAQILWIVKSRKLEVVKQEIRKKTHSANSLRQERVTIVAAESLPENIAKKKWTLVVFQELDLLLTSNAHIRTYQNLNRLWSIASLTKQDWNKDRKRLDSTLAVFQLTPSDATLFQAKCVQNFIQQQSSFFSKLTAFFKPVTTQDFEKTRDETTKDVPIPPRAVSKQPVAPTISEVATANISRTGQSSTSFQSPKRLFPALKYLQGVL